MKRNFIWPGQKQRSMKLVFFSTVCTHDFPRGKHLPHFLNVVIACCWWRSRRIEMHAADKASHSVRETNNDFPGRITIKRNHLFVNYHIAMRKRMRFSLNFFIKILFAAFIELSLSLFLRCTVVINSSSAFHLLQLSTYGWMINE